MPQVESRKYDAPTRASVQRRFQESKCALTSPISIVALKYFEDLLCEVDDIDGAFEFDELMKDIEDPLESDLDFNDDNG